MINNVETFWIPIITSILSSGVIVGIFQFIQWNKNKKLENITAERKAWRDDLRKIVEDLYNSNDNNEINFAITKLKVRINPKGMFMRNSNEFNLDDKLDYFEHDAYLWETIELIENTPDYKMKKTLVSNLIELISILIKYDWDRAKSEISFSSVSKAKIWYYLLLSIQIIGVFILNILCLNTTCWLFILSVNCITYILYPLLLPYARYKLTMNRDVKLKNKNKRNKYRRFFLYNQKTTFYCYIVLAIWLAIYSFIIVQNFPNNNLVLLLAFTSSILALLFYFSSTHFAEVSRYFSIEYYYILVSRIIKKTKSYNNKK